MASNKNSDKKLTKTINSVGIVGGGTMGRGTHFLNIIVITINTIIHLSRNCNEYC